MQTHSFFNTLDFQHRSYKLVEPESERKLQSSNDFTAEVALKKKCRYLANDPFKFATAELTLAEDTTVERALSKCPLCPLIVTTDVSQDAEKNPIRVHFFQTHLIQDLTQRRGETATARKAGENVNDRDR